MKKASITDAKNNLSALIDRVKAGSQVLIVDRGRPVARLIPVNESGADGDEQLSVLIRTGVVCPGRSPAVPSQVWSERPPRLRKGASGVRALLDERREGR